jgi:CRISPR-associated protein Csm5
MVWNNQVNVLDQGRIFRLLSRGPRLDGYLAQLKKATKLDFASWGGFAQNFSQRRIPFENAEAATIWNNASSESLFIPTFAADHRGAYLPASALKGALRTGFVSSRWNAATMDKVAASLEGDRLPRRVADQAENASGASQTRVLGMADSQPAGQSSFRIFLTRVSSLDTRQPGKPQLSWKVTGRGSVPAGRVSDATPLFAEMAIPGTSFSGEWDEKTFLENPELGRALGWRSVPTPNMLLEAANTYAAGQLEIHGQYAGITGLDTLGNTVSRLQGEVTSAQSAPLSCVMCLGWGGGFVSKAAFLSTEGESYRKVLKTTPIGRSIREGVPFPKTRRIVFLNGQPSTLPGWVRLELEK